MAKVYLIMFTICTGIASLFLKGDSYSGNVSSFDLFDDPFLTFLVFLITGVIGFLRESRKRIKFEGKSIKIVDVFDEEQLLDDDSVSYLSKPPNNTRVIEESIQLVDPNFNTGRFIAWTKEVFVKLNAAWVLRDWASIRPFEHESLFSLHALKLQEYIDKQRTDHYEDLVITEAYLYKYDVDNAYEHLTICVDAVSKHYLSDDNDGLIISGDAEKEVYETYLMTFMRRLGIQTNIDFSNKSTSKCPNCGAPTNITSSGKCEYCQVVITTGDHDWVMTHYSKLEINTAIDITPVSISSENYSDYVKYETKSTSSLIFLRTYTKDEYVLKKVNEELKKRDGNFIVPSKGDITEDVKCPECNTMNEKGSTFCSFCYHKL